MPELPEVEVCRRGLLPELLGRQITGARAGKLSLRRPLPPQLMGALSGRTIHGIERRGKYLLFDCRRAEERGWLIIHLGMSGHLHFVRPGQPPGKHDHFDLLTDASVLRYTDPRRFGLILWHSGSDPFRQPLLAGLGVEPLSRDFDGNTLHALLLRRGAPVKTVVMDSHTVVGIGNIYASESLFRAGISPLRPARTLTPEECRRLSEAIRKTLHDAIAAGGSSIRDYLHSDGSSGCFQLEYAVYGRTGQPCKRCGGTIHNICLTGRSSFYCPDCQK